MSSFVSTQQLSRICRCNRVWRGGVAVAHTRAGVPACEGSLICREAVEAIPVPDEAQLVEKPKRHRDSRVCPPLAHALVGEPCRRAMPLPRYARWLARQQLDSLLTADWFTGFVPQDVRVPEVPHREVERETRLRFPIGSRYYETVTLRRPGVYSPKRVEVSFERQTESSNEPFVGKVWVDTRPRVTVEQRAQDEYTHAWLRRDEWELHRESKRRNQRGGSVEGDRHAPGLAGEREWLNTQLNELFSFHRLPKHLQTSECVARRERRVGSLAEGVEWKTDVRRFDARGRSLKVEEAKHHAKALRARFNTRRYVEALGGDPDSPEFVAWRKKQPMSYAQLNEVLAAKVEQRFLACELGTLAVPGLVAVEPRRRAPQFARSKMTSIAGGE